MQNLSIPRTLRKHMATEGGLLWAWKKSPQKVAFKKPIRKFQCSKCKCFIKYDARECPNPKCNAFFRSYE